MLYLLNPCKVSECKFCLFQNVHFRAKRHGSGWEHTRNQKTTLAEHKGEGCEGHRTVQFERTPLFIPSCPPSNLEGCDIMDIQYWVEVSTSYFANNLHGLVT